MTKRTLSLSLALTALLIVIQPMIALAKSQSGGVIDPSTVLGFGPRAGAMGNAYIALGDDATMVYWNPASLDLNRRKELFGQYSQVFFDNTTYNMLAYKHPIGRFGTLGGGLIIEGVSDLTRRDVNASNIGTFNVSKTNLMFSYGKQMTQGFYLGTSLHILRQQIAEFTGTGFGLDVSALYRVTNRHVEYSRAYLKMARESVRQDAERLYTIGMRAYETGKYADALENFRKAVETDPTDKAARRMMLLTVQKDRALADRLKQNPPLNGHTTMAEFLKTHAANGTRSTTLQKWFEEGVKLYDSGKIKEAIPFFEAVIRHARSDYLTDRLSVGMNMQNLLEPSIKLKSTADDVPLNIKLGTSYRITDWLSVALDLDVPSKGAQRIHFGVEWRPIEWLAVRAGLDHDEPTFGFGFRYQDLKIDYAFMPSNDLDKDLQRVGLSYEFGKSEGDLAAERIQRGLTLQSQKDYSSAAKEWEQAQKLQPTNPLPRVYMKASEEEYRRTVTAPFSEAERYLAAGRLMEAQPILTSILSYDAAFEPAKAAMERLSASIPDYVESRFKAGYLKYLQGDYLAAQDEMNRVLYFRPDHASAEQYRNAARKHSEETARRRTILDLYVEGMKEYRAGRWAEALSRFETVLRRDATHPAAGAVIGQIAEFEAAEFLPEERRAESEKFAALATAHLYDGQVPDAEIAVSHALALWPESVEAQNLLYRIQARKNADLIESLRRGDQEMEQGNADRAAAEWQKVAEADPGNRDVAKRYEQNVDAFRNFVETQNRSAERHERAGEAVEAVRDYTRAIAVDPFNAIARQRREALRPQIVASIEKRYDEAESLYRRGELDKSLAILSELIAIDPELAQARDLEAMAKRAYEQNIALVRMTRLYNQGMEYFQSGNFEQAVALWQQAVAEKPALPEADRIAQDVETQMAAALKQLEKSRIDADISDHLERGDRHLDAGQAVEALSEFRKVMEIQPENPNLAWRLESARKLAAGKLSEWLAKGSEALAEGRWEDASAFYEAVLGIDAENAEAQEGMSRIELAKMEKEETRMPEEPVELRMSEVDTSAVPVLAAERTDAPSLSRSALGHPWPAPTVGPAERPRPTTEEQVQALLAKAADARRKADAAVAQNRIDLAVGRIQKAMQSYREVLKRVPNERTAQSGLTELRTTLTRLQKDLKARREGDVQKYLYSGMGHYRSGRLKEAIADWNRVLSIDPAHQQAREYIRRAEKKLEWTR